MSRSLTKMVILYRAHHTELNQPDWTLATSLIFWLFLTVRMRSLSSSYLNGQQSRQRSKCVHSNQPFHLLSFRERTTLFSSSSSSLKVNWGRLKQARTRTWPNSPPPPQQYIVFSHLVTTGFCCCSSSELSPPLSESVSPVAKKRDILCLKLVHVVHHARDATGHSNSGFRISGYRYPGRSAVGPDIELLTNHNVFRLKVRSASETQYLAAAKR